MLDESGTKFNVIVVSAMAETHVIVRLAPAESHASSRAYSPSLSDTLTSTPFPLQAVRER